MQQTCKQCGSAADGSSRFCTNCGTVLGPVQTYRQAWEAPPQNQGQVPSWAQPESGAYGGMSTPNSGGSLGFGGASDAQAKRLLKIAVCVVLGALLLLIVCIALAIAIPVPGVRTFFLIVALLLILIPWIIYTQIRRIIRRTIGRIWWFM